MTVSAQTPINRSTGNGVTTVFPYTFKIISEADIELSIDDVVKTLNVDYTVSGAGADAGGNVTMTAAPASLTSVVRRRNMGLVRTTDYQDQGTLPATTLDNDIDNVVLMVQQVNEQIGRALTAPPSLAGFSGELPTPQGSNVIGWNPDGTGFQNYGPADSSLLTVALSASSGASLVGYISSGTGAVAATVQTVLRRIVWVDDYDVNTVPGTTDMTAAINEAIVAAGSGGEVRFLNAQYRTTAFINAENLRGVTLTGVAGQYGWSGTRIIGSHTGKTILSLVGSLFCDVKNISLEGDTAARPKTGLLLGRSSAASAGNHTFTNVKINGYHSVAGLYNIASEENTFINCYLGSSAAPLAGVYMCQADGQAGYTIGGLTSSSMECNTFVGGTIGNSDNTAGSAALYIDSGAATGHHQFFGTFMFKNGGDSFIYIRLGAVDGQNSSFPLSFYNVIGEMGASAPTNGMHITAGGSFIMSGLTAINMRFQTPTTNHILCDGAGSVYLVGANISTPYLSGGALTSTFMRVDLSTLNLQYEASVTISNTASTGNNITTNALSYVAATLTNSWVNTFGVSNGFFAPGYIKDQFGYVHLRGISNGGTIALPMFTLPAGFRPTSNTRFIVNSNGAVGSLDILSDGTVTLGAGSNAYVSLDGITFKAGT